MTSARTEIVNHVCLAVENVVRDRVGPFPRSAVSRAVVGVPSLAGVPHAVCDALAEVMP
jgi:hypothetical protein